MSGPRGGAKGRGRQVCHKTWLSGPFVLAFSLPLLSGLLAPCARSPVKHKASIRGSIYWQALASLLSFLILAGGILLAADDSVPPRPEDYVPRDPSKQVLPKGRTQLDIPEGLVTPPHLRFDQPFQKGPRCGPNSVYLLLRLNGITVPYDEVVKRVPLETTGADLESLRLAAASFGLVTETRQLTPEDVLYAPKPILVHFNAPAAASGGAQNGPDHFGVITGIMSDGAYQGVDTNNLRATTFSSNNFARNFSGYCLVVPRSSLPWLFSLRAGLFAAALAALIGLNLFLARRLKA